MFPTGNPCFCLKFCHTPLIFNDFLLYLLEFLIGIPNREVSDFLALFSSSRGHSILYHASGVIVGGCIFMWRKVSWVYISPLFFFFFSEQSWFPKHKVNVCKQKLTGINPAHIMRYNKINLITFFIPTKKKKIVCEINLFLFIKYFNYRHRNFPKIVIKNLS